MEGHPFGVSFHKPFRIAIAPSVLETLKMFSRMSIATFCEEMQSLLVPNYLVGVLVVI